MRKIFFKQSLEFEISLIGYKQQGECILFCIKADNKVVYIGLVDSYKTSSYDYVTTYMETNHINYFDFVCWTHPHDDHTKGLDEIINKYCDKNTKFWTTDIQTDYYDIYSKEATEVYKHLRNFHLSDDKNGMMIKYAKDHTVLEKLICSGMHDYMFQIDSFAPNSTLLAERTYEDKIEQGNLYSIGLFINIGRYNIILGGDVENKTFSTLDEFEFGYPVDYIKIPHHGSSTSSVVIDRFRENNISAPNIATTTVYRSGKLPQKETIIEYKNWGTKNICCTGSFFNSETEQNEYGVIKTNFDILENREYKIETMLEKNATEFKSYDVNMND